MMPVSKVGAEVSQSSYNLKIFVVLITVVWISGASSQWVKTWKNEWKVKIINSTMLGK